MTSQPFNDDATRTAERTALRKATWRLIPLAGLGYLFNYIDRTNVGFTSLTMNADLGLTVALVGMNSSRAPFFSMPSQFLTGAAAATGVAFINSFGNLGGFLGPYLMGWLRDTTGSFTAGLFCLGAILAMSGVIAMLLNFTRKIERDR